MYSVFTSVMLGAQKQSMCMGSVDECLLCLKPLLEGLCLSVLCVRVCVCVCQMSFQMPGGTNKDSYMM